MERRSLKGGTSEASGAPSRLDPPADDLARRLFPALATDVDWALDRTAAALEELGDPHRAFRSLHIGGTNGKGSVAACCASALRSAGSHVGLYTSPHLVSFTERFRIDGRPVAEDRLLRVAGDVRAPVERHGLTFFEAATVLAFELFRREGVEVAVVEVGLGGRLDATNVLEPDVVAVTNVALDHVEHLGRDLEVIAREKAGIVKEGVPFATAEAAPGPLAVLRRAARERGAPFHGVRMEELDDLRVGPEGSRFHLRTEAWGAVSVRSPLPGRHQALNAALAVRILALLPDEARPTVDAVERGLASVRWPGRLQAESIGGRTWVLDVAHNPAAAEALLAALPLLAPPEPWVFLVAMPADKDAAGVLPRLVAAAGAVVLTVPPGVPASRRWDPRAARALAGGGAEVEAVPGFDEALARAAERAGPGGSVVVTGSHHTVGAALEKLGLSDEPAGRG